MLPCSRGGAGQGHDVAVRHQTTDNLIALAHQVGDFKVWWLDEHVRKAQRYGTVY